MNANVGSIEYDARISTEKLRSDAAGLESKVQSLGSSLNKHLGGAMDGVARSSTYLATRLAIAGAGFSLLGKSALNQTSDFQQARIAFDTMLGSVEQGQKMMQRLSDFAKRTPFSLPQVVEGSKSLLAYGLAAEEVIPTFQALGNIAAGVGRDKLPQLTLAFGQVRAAGKLTGAELRQFTEAGVPLLEQLAKQSGKSAAQIKEDMENGMAPSFDEVRNALFAMTTDGGKFFNLMEKQSMTFAGRMSNIGDSIGQIIRGMLGVDVAGNIQPGSVFDKVSKAAEQLMMWLEANKDRITASIQGMFTWIQNNGPAIAVFVGTILTAAFASWAISVVAATWPILALAAAVTGLYLLYQRFKPQIDSVIDAFQRFWELIRPLREFVANQFMTAWNDLKASFDRIKATLEPFMPQLKQLAVIIGVVVVTPLVLLIATVGAAIAILVAIITVVARVIGIFTQLQSKVWEVAGAMHGAISERVSQVIGVFRSLPSQISGALGDLGSLLYGAGRNVIMGFVRGIKDNIGAVKDTLTGLTGKLADWKGPLSTDKVVLQKSGQAVIGGFIAGLESQYKAVQNSLGGLTGSLSGNTMPSYATAGMRSISNMPDVASGGESSIVNNIGTINVSSEVDADNLLRRLTKEQEVIGKGLTPPQRYA